MSRFDKLVETILEGLDMKSPDIENSSDPNAFAAQLGKFIEGLDPTQVENFKAEMEAINNLPESDRQKATQELMDKITSKNNPEQPSSDSNPEDSNPEGNSSVISPKPIGA